MPRAVVDLTASSPPQIPGLDFRLRKDPALKSTIDTAPIDRLRQSLRAICSCSEKASVIARALLPPTLDDGGEKLEAGGSEDRKDTGSKDDDEEEDEDFDEPAIPQRPVVQPTVRACDHAS